MLDDHFQFKMFMFSIILNPFDGRIRLTSYLHLAHAHIHRIIYDTTKVKSSSYVIVSLHVSIEKPDTKKKMLLHTN